MNYVIIKGKKFPIEVAISSEEQQRGLMYKDPPLYAMAFPYARPQFNSFWMSNVKADLDIVFCLKNKIASIWKGEAKSTSIIGGRDPSDLILEFPYGVVKAEGISVGDDISLDLSKEAQMKFLMLKTGLIF